LSPSDRAPLHRRGVRPTRFHSARMVAETIIAAVLDGHLRRRKRDAPSPG